MPTYSYRCTKCEKVFDSFHSMSCTDPQYCPVCGAVGTKLLSASSVIFKGSGFYSTDYRDSGYLEAEKKEENTMLTDNKSSEKTEKESKPKTQENNNSTETTKTEKKPETKKAA
ncbi:MAG: hypothetical protein J6Z11_01465 [Candidatus Riflebacteria bacterium]|nr:hypothetical protein [Candidatus Riflebacteria bacterium]